MEVKLCEKLLQAYESITTSEEFKELEWARRKAEHDEAQALANENFLFRFFNYAFPFLLSFCYKKLHNIINFYMTHSLFIHKFRTHFTTFLT